MIPGATEIDSKKKRRNKKKRKSHNTLNNVTESNSLINDGNSIYNEPHKQTDIADTMLIIQTEERDLSSHSQRVDETDSPNRLGQPKGDEPPSEPDSGPDQTEEIKPKPKPKSVWNDLRRERLEKVGDDRIALLKSFLSRGLILGHERLSKPMTVASIEAVIDRILDQSNTKCLMMTLGPPLERAFYILPQEDDSSPLTPVPTGMYNQLSLNLCFATSVFQMLLSSHYLVAAMTLIARPCYSLARMREGEERVLGILLACLDSTGIFSLSSRNKFLSTGDQQDAAEFLGHTLDELAEMPEFSCPVRRGFEKVGAKGKNVTKNEPVQNDTKVSIFTTLYHGCMVTTLPNHKTYTEPFNMLMVHLDDRHLRLDDLIEFTLRSNNSKLDVIPPMLFVQLQRTIYDNGMIHKSSAPVDVPGELRIRREWLTDALYEYWAANDEWLDDQYTFRLKAVICHFGNFNDGHYMCYAHRGGGKHPDKPLGDCWFACDDTSIVNQFTHNDLNDWTHNGCLFLYEQRHVRPVNPLASLLLQDQYSALPPLYRVLLSE